MKSHLRQYRGWLSPTQIAAGMRAAAQNAKRLAADARLLFEHDRYSSATALAILAIEESGKLRVLRGLALARSEEELKEAWRDYRTHTAKNQMWLLIDSALAGASKLRDFRHLFEEGAEHPKILDQVKQVGFYSDCLGAVHWSLPNDVIDKDLARLLVRVADLVSTTHEVTEEEIDLWIHHLKPVYRTGLEAMEKALIAFDKEMRARGLTPDGLPTMEEFVTEGIDLTNAKRA